MDLTTAEKKTIAKSIKIASSYGTDEVKKMNSDKVKDLSDKARTLDKSKREELFQDLKNFNKRRSLRTINSSLNELFAKYEIVEKEEEKEEEKPTTPKAPTEPTEPLEPIKEKATPKKPSIKKLEMEGAGAGAGAGKETESQPAKKPEKPKASYPPKLRKKPKVEASKPKPPTIDKTREEEPIPKIERAKAKVKGAEERLQQTIDELPPEQQEPPTPLSTPPSTPTQPIQLKTTKPREREVKTGLEDIPSKIDLIPPERLSSEFKSVKELEADIAYFFKTFPKQLESIKKSYDKAKKSPEYVKRTHKRIVATLRAGAKKTKEKVGVIIEGNEFIKDKLREIYIEEIGKGLTAEDLLVQVEGKQGEKTSDIGNYEIVKGPSGKEHSQREPIYRYIPEGEQEDPKEEKKSNRIPNLPTKYRSRFTYENGLYENNPFRKKQPTIQLRKLY